MNRKLMGVLLPAVLLSGLIAGTVFAQGTPAPAAQAAPAVQAPAQAAPAAQAVPAVPAVQSGPTLGERVLGPADAKVTVIEYASLTCPACAQFQAGSVPGFKSKWVEGGKVRFIYRDFPRNQLDIVASVMIRCATPERQFAFYDILFKNQSNWISNDKEKVEAALIRYGRLGGLSEEQIRACWSDQSLAERVMKDRLDGQKEFDIKATPTIVINGKTYEGALTNEELDRLLEAATH